MDKNLTDNNDFCLRQSDRVFLLCVMLMGLIVRAWRIMEYDLPCPDAASYLIYTKYYLDLLLGKTDAVLRLDDFVKPGYLLLGMPVMFVIGYHQIVFHVVNLFFGVVNIELVFRITARMGRKPAGYLAAVCAATYPIIVFLDRYGISHTVSGSFFLLAVLWYVKGIQANRRSGILCGLFAGLAAIVHPSLIFYGFLIGASETVYVLVTKSLKKTLQFGVSFTLFAALPFLAMEIIYKFIYWAVPVLRAYPNVPLWKNGFVYQLFEHHASSATTGGWSFVIDFMPYQYPIAIFVLIFLAITLFLLKTVFLRSENMRVCHYAVFLLTLVPVPLLSLLYPNDRWRLLYPAYLLLCVAYGLGASFPIEILERVRSKRLLWGITLSLCFFLAVVNTQTFLRNDAQDMTDGARTEKVLTAIRNKGYERIMIFGHYKQRTWAHYMYRVFGCGMYRMPSIYYTADIKVLLKRIKERDIEGIVFLNEQRFAESAASKAFVSFVEKNHLDFVPLFTGTNHPLPYVVLYDVRDKKLVE